MAGAEDVGAGGEPLLDEHAGDAPRLLVAGEGGVDGDDAGSVMPCVSPSRCAAVTIAREQQHRHALVRDGDVDLDARQQGEDAEQDLARRPRRSAAPPSRQ